MTGTITKKRIARIFGRAACWFYNDQHQWHPKNLQFPGDNPGPRPVIAALDPHEVEWPQKAGKPRPTADLITGLHIGAVMNDNGEIGPETELSAAEVEQAVLKFAELLGERPTHQEAALAHIRAWQELSGRTKSDVVKTLWTAATATKHDDPRFFYQWPPGRRGLSA